MVGAGAGPVAGTAGALPVAEAEASSASMRATRSRRGAAGWRACSSASNCFRSSSMAIGDGQLFAQGDERVAIARGGGVGRDLELFGDLLKGELAPDLEDEDFALLVAELAKGDFDGLAAFIAIERSVEQRSVFLEAALGEFFPDGAAGVAAGEIESRAADRGD